ncbi:MAG: autotransporter-associated beta strand repeat-containing protein, partial [Planctomycetales bacterium]|nr:autotransporter-associated beta strand repeat-containing protein [Planctomycetales bacterium]
MSITSSSRFILSFAVAWLISVSAHAVSVNLTGIDALGASSFNTAGLWDNAAAPSAGNDYFVGDGARLRTPADGASYTFAGDSLTINNTTGYADGILYKGTGNTGVITVANLILDGGLISHGNGTGDVFQLDGGLTVTSDSRFYAKQGHINILSDLSGAANLEIQATDANTTTTERIVTLFGDNSGFSGSISVLGKLTAADTSTMMFDIGASGVNNTISGTGFGVFNGVFNFDLTGASSTPGDSWAITSVASQTYGATFSVGGGFSQLGSVWTNGTYVFNPGTGILSVSAPPIEWNTDLDNQPFSVGTNWVGGSAPGTGEDALFGSVITGPRTVVLDGSTTINALAFDNANSYTITDNGGGETLTIGTGNVTVANGSHAVAAVITGSAGLTKLGGGTLALSANNTYSGATNVNAGTLNLQASGAVDGGVTVAPGAELGLFTAGAAGGDISVADNRGVIFWGDDQNGTSGGLHFAGSYAGIISGAGGIDLENDAEVTLTGANTFAGAIDIWNESVLTLSGSGTLGASDGTPATETRVNEGGRVALTGKAVGDELLQLSARQDALVDAVHLTSSGTSSWAGNIIGVVGGTQYNIESTSGTLTLSGVISAPDTNVRDFVFSGDGNFVVSKITDGLVDANGDISGVGLNDSVNVVKRGAGTLTINTQTDTNVDYHLGTTTIEGGTLVVMSDGSNNGELRSDIIVNEGATFDISSFGTYNLIPISLIEVGLAGGGTINLGGTGTLGAYEATTFTPGDNGVGTLDIAGNLSLTYFDNGATVAPDTGSLNFELGSSGSVVGGGENDLISVTGALTIDSNALSNQFVVNVTPVAGSLDAANNYVLINSGSLSLVDGASAANFVVNIVDAAGAPLVSRQSGAIVLNGSSGEVELDISGSPLNLNWAGASASGDGIWDVNNNLG